MFNPWVRKIPWSRKWQPIPVFLSRKFHGQRSVTGYSLCGTAERQTPLSTCTHGGKVCNRSLLFTTTCKSVISKKVTCKAAY